MTYRDALHEDQRLVILRTLADMNGYQANDSVLQTVLGAFGHNISRELVQSHLAFLAEQALVSIEVISGVQVATLSARGQDVAAGRADAPGVKRPGAPR
ncbi:ArsR family transcriptional regulator [Candidatus Sororendozoicomonas aggregata]|uniref:VpaChn25_0724 family phage protein n=1 Tax=Candidatus Sororendozoicomonas aggregata TaxID=3073239 RepID=UPI002ED53B8D